MFPFSLSGGIKVDVSLAPFCRFFYASSACIYPEFKQLETTNVSLKESDAWPAEV